VAWYLRKLREHEQRTGTKLLDLFDLHFYPQAKGMGLGTQGRTDAASAALRIRSTRALWDPSYKDESWIEEPVMLIPRMKQWVAENYPGLGIVLGEYNFGAEEHISGGLAVAEALGRFGQQGLTAAFYWTYPAHQSAAYWAFRAYRNYDGQGARFLDQSVATQTPDGVSLFASRDESGKLVAIALNLDPQQPLKATVSSENCGNLRRGRTFQYTGGPAGLQSVGDAGEAVELPPYSITVLELEAKKP
jgi:hypothetical protein